MSRQGSTRGQRRGFYWQDWYAAWIMLRCWAQPADAITAVEVEAADAPHVDDIVIHQASRTLFKQLKHKVAGPFTGADLFSATRSGPSLIRKLFHGWETMRTAVGSGIEVHLTTNAMPSSGGTNQLISPVRFQRDILIPARSATWTWPEALKPICDELLRLTRAPDLPTVRAFLAALRLEFGEPNEEHLRRLVVTILRDQLRPATTAETEADAWVARVYELSTRHPSSGPLSRTDIDREVRTLFGAMRRRAEHRLALPDHHVPRPTVAATILDAALQIGTGYLLVMGPPGCGKTTLATWIANEHDDQLMMRYHVFDPRLASGLERQGRASGLEFVRTMFDVLCDRFPDEASPYVPVEATLSAAVAALREELQRLAGDKPRVLLVDGIDHIVRAGVGRGSLFDALPQPAPANVVFALFGQPDWEYPAWLGRAPRVSVPPFTEVETRSVVCARMGWELDDAGAAAVADSLHDKSRGNPLSLFYNLAVAETIGDTPGEVSASLQRVTFFGGAPHEEYGRLLDDLETILPAPHSSKSLKRELLAFLAVAGAAVTADRLSAGFVDDGLTLRQACDFLEGLRPVVFERQHGRYWLFHDDFRRYAEQRSDQSELSAAHRRFARVLEHDWHCDELEAWVEHLWHGGEYRRLASLVRERTLEEWFAIAPPRFVLALHRLSFAAAFKLGEELGILENALAASRAAEAADLPSAEGDGPPPASGLKAWSFLVPPSGTASGSLRRRTAALEAAANGCQREPALAAEIANRFLLPLEMIPDTDEHELEDYVLALQRWLLRCGDLRGARELAASERFDVLAINAVGAEVATETDADVLEVWAEAFAGMSASLDRDLVKAAALHLAEGRDQSALSIVRALAWRPSVTAEIERDAAVLLSLLAGKNFTETRHLEAKVRLAATASDAHEWREFFFHGFTAAAAGPLRELALYNFPTRFEDFFKNGRHRNSERQLARFLWRCGCAAGLASRGPDLLTPQELATLLRPFIGEGGLELEPLEVYIFLGFVQLYLPWMMLAVRQREALLTKAVELLLPAARRFLARPDPRTYGLLEATWLVDQSAWRSMAADALALTELPGSDAANRVQWFEYWKSRAAARGVDTSRNFLARSAVAALGVPRKTDPVDLAMQLLLIESDGGIDMAAAVRCLVDLLIRLDAEPEGGRAAHHHLPQVLAIALQTSPSLFLEEFLRSTVEHAVSEPFGAAPAQIALDWFREDEFISVDELLVIWYWVAASPGCFGSDSVAAEVGAIVVERLMRAGARQEATSVARWCAALAKQGSQDEASPQAKHQARAVVGCDSDLPESLPGMSSTDEETSNPSTPPKSPPPTITDLELRWFSSWWAPEQNLVLREFLARGGEEAWNWVCERLGDRIANNPDYSAYEADVVAAGLIRLRPCRPSARAVDIAIQHVAQKVRFQAMPRPRGTGTGEQTRVQAMVALLARGADVSDVETLRRSLRSLGALARRPSTAAVVERELLPRLEANEARTVTHSLLVLREIHSLSAETREKIGALTTHPDAWCRWLACRILDSEPAWPAPRLLVTTAGPIASDPCPARHEFGATYYSDISSVREIYLRKFKALLDVGEHELRSLLEIEFRDLPTRPERPSGWHRRTPGPSLTSQGMGEAAGRLACRLCSVAPDVARPAVLSAVARQDPWLLMAEPAVDPPHDWIEVCRFERRTTPEREEYMLRSLAIMPRNLLSRTSSSRIAASATALLVPEAPAEFSWVAEPWPVMASPRMPKGEIIPLSFYNRLFTELRRDQFMLVPRWDLAPFAELRFVVKGVPAWVHPKLGPVLVGACGERLAKPGGAEHPTIDWWTGWYASPRWLRSFDKPHTFLTHLWQVHWSTRHSQNDKGDGTLEHGLEHDLIRWR